MQTNTSVSWLNPDHYSAITALSDALSLNPSVRSEDRIVFGDTTAQEGRIYIMPIDDSIMKRCIQDQAMYAHSSVNKISAQYLKHIQQHFSIPDTVVVKFDNQLIPIRQVLRALEGLCNEWGVTAENLLLNRLQPGFTVYCPEVRAGIQFAQPRHRFQF